MAQLSIPQSLIGALIDIADLGTLDYFRHRTMRPLVHL